jgi:hypothetical protein
MVESKFGIKVSKSTIGRLLKKYGNDRPGKAQTTPLVMTQQI